MSETKKVGTDRRNHVSPVADDLPPNPGKGGDGFMRDEQPTKEKTERAPGQSNEN